MRTFVFLMISVILTGLCACRHDSSVVKSSIQIATVLRGDVIGPAGSQKGALYLRRPFLSTENSESILFRIEPDQKHAVQVRVRFGDIVMAKPGATGERPYVEVLTGMPNVEVLSGLSQGDQVILSDMSALKSEQRVELR